MNKTDMLFVRACKRQGHRRHVLAVYRRFYYGYHDDKARELQDAAQVLWGVCQRVYPIPAEKLLDMLKPDWCSPKRPYWERAFDSFSSWLALTEREHLPEYVPPLSFRRRYEWPALSKDSVG